jgi:hypothetical protein
MSDCANCCTPIEKDDTGTLTDETGGIICSSCNECDLCRQPLDLDTSDFENWVCEDCIGKAHDAEN